jgi:predicted Zn-dependent protease
LIQANAHLLLRDLRAAEVEFTGLAGSHPQNPVVQERLGYVAFLQKRFVEAEQRFEEALRLQPDFAPALVSLAGLYRMQGKPNQALARIQHQIERAPQQSDFYELLGAGYLDAGDLTQAEKAYRDALTQNSKAYMSNLNLAQIYARQGKHAQAIAEMEAALEARPEFLPGYSLLGSYYEQAGNTEQAKRAYEKALELDSNFAQALNNLAWLYCEREQNLDLALSLARRAKELLPDNPNVSDTLAWIHYRKRAYHFAIPLLEEVVRQAPDNGVFHYHLGMAYRKAGYKARAATALRRALDRGLAAADAEQARQTLQEITQDQGAGAS